MENKFITLTHLNTITTKILDVIKSKTDDIEKIDGLLNTPEMHARIFRGKNLGTSVTDTQKTAIQEGTFSDLYVGDYWVIDDITWRIVDIDYWYNTGANQTRFVAHHLVIMPDTVLYTQKINETEAITGGYVHTTMHTEGLTTAKTTITNAFGDLVLTRSEPLSSSNTGGIITNATATDATVELPSEIMMFGTNIFSSVGDGTQNYQNYMTSKTQLALFNIAPKYIVKPQSWYWLRDLVTDSTFAGISGLGAINSAKVTSSFGVRPVFCIGTPATSNEIVTEVI